MYQVKGLQVSLSLHAVALMLAWGMSGSMGHSAKSTMLDLCIIHGLGTIAHEVMNETAPEPPREEKTPPTQEQEASVDGSIVASIAEAHTASPKNTESTGREGPLSESVEFGSAAGPFYHHQVMPVYPVIARKMGKEGRVLLRLTIDEKGNLLNVEVLEDPGYGFAEAAVKAVKKSTFVPAKRVGDSVFAKALLPIKFVLRDF